MSDAFYTAWAEVVPDFSQFGRKVDQGFKDAMQPAGERAGDDAGKGLRGGLLGAVGKLAGPLAAAFAGLQLGSLIKDSIAQASDLQEAGTAIGEVFGDQAAAIKEFAQGGAAAFGETEINVLRAAQSFGIYGKAAGLAGGDLTAFSTDLVGLGTDLASFFNTDTQTAIDAIGAGLRGEAEPLRQFGVLLDDATLKARAMELGIYSGTGSLTQQQRVLAAQAEILAQTSTAQGDFARTSGGLANQQRILSAGWSNLVTQLGTLFLPLATTIVGFLNTNMIPALSGVVSWLTGGGLSGAFATLSSVVGPVIDVLAATFVPVIEQLAPLFSSVIPQLVALWTQFSPLGLVLQAITPLLPVLMASFQQFAGVIAGVLGQALGILIPLFNQIATILAGALGTAVQAIAPMFLQLVPIVAQLASTLGGVFGTVLQALAPVIQMVVGFIAQLVPVIMPLITAVLGLVGPILQLLDPLFQLIGAILPPLIQLFMAVLGPVLELASAIIGALMPVIQGLLDVLGGLITFVTGVFSGDWDMAWRGIQQMFQGFVDAIGALIDGGLKLLFEDIPKFISDIFSGVGDWLVSAGGDLIQGFIDGINGAIGMVGDAIGGVMDFIGGFFPHSPAKRGPFSGSGWKAVAEGGAALMEQFVGGADGIGALTFGASMAGGTALSPRVSVPNVSRQLADVAVDRAVYVQNPFTGDYLLARVDDRADRRIGSYDSQRARESRRGERI